MYKYKALIAEDNQLLALIIDNILNDLNLENTIVHSRKDTLLAYHNDRLKYGTARHYDACPFGLRGKQ